MTLLEKKTTETVINAIPAMLKNAFTWAKDHFDKQGQDAFDNANGTIGLAIKLFAQPVIDGYFKKQTDKKLDNFGLGIYFKAALIQGNKSIAAIEDELKRKTSAEKIVASFNQIAEEQRKSFKSSDVLLIFRPKYHPAVIEVKETFLRILRSLGANQVAINAFKKNFNDHIEEQIKEEFGDDYQTHLEETKTLRLKDKETDLLWDMRQLGKIAFKESEDLEYEETFAHWEQVSAVCQKERQPEYEDDHEKQENNLHPINQLIDDYFRADPNNNVKKILFIVADFGKGKSVFLKRWASELAKLYLQTGEGDFPVYFNLRNFKNYSSESKTGVIGEYLETDYGIKIDDNHFRGKPYIFLIDSLDESGELTKASIDKVVESIKRIQNIDKGKYRTNRIIITSRPFDDGLERHLRDHEPHIIENEERREIEYFIRLYGFKKEQFNHWLIKSLKGCSELEEIEKTSGFAQRVVTSIKQRKEIDVYAELLEKKTLSMGELRRPIFAYMIYQLILKNIDFSGIGKIGVYLSFLNLLTKEAKHVHDPGFQVHLKEEFAFRNILHAVAALWMRERQRGKQGTLKKSDICRVLDGENRGDPDEEVLKRYKEKGVTEIQFLSHSYFGEEANSLHFHHQSFAEILLAEYYLKVFIKYALDKESSVEEARQRLILGLPTDQTIQFFKEMLGLLKDTVAEKATPEALEKRKLLFPLMASLATENHNRLFCNEIYYGWYKYCKIKENQTECPPQSLESWCITEETIDKILELAKEILNSKTNYILAQAEVKTSLYDKELLAIQNNKLNHFPPDIDRWLALLAGNELCNDLTNEDKPSLFNWDHKIDCGHLFDLIRNWNYAFGSPSPEWGETLFMGIDMRSNDDEINLSYHNFWRLNFSYSYFRNFNAYHSNFYSCIFLNNGFDNVDMSNSNFTESIFFKIKSLKFFLIDSSRIDQNVFMPVALSYIFGESQLNFGSSRCVMGSDLHSQFGLLSERLENIFLTLQGLLIYALEHENLTINEIKTWFQFELPEFERTFFQKIDSLKKYEAENTAEKKLEQANDI